MPLLQKKVVKVKETVNRIANNGLSIGKGSKEKVFPKRESKPR